MTVLNDLEEGGLSFITDCTEEDKAFKHLGKVLHTFDITIEGLDTFIRWIKMSQLGNYHVLPNLDLEFRSKDDLYTLFSIDSLVCRYFGSLVMIEPSLYVKGEETVHSYMLTLAKELYREYKSILKEYKLVEDEVFMMDLLFNYYDYFKRYVKDYITKSIVRCHPRVTIDNVISITNLVNLDNKNNKLTVPSDYGLLLDMERNRIFIYLADVKYKQMANTLEGLLVMKIRRVMNGE